MPFANVTDGRLFYNSYGKGRPLVLIHSAWATHAWWRWQIPDLSRRYRIVSYDVRGHGKSTPIERISSIDVFSNDLQTLLQRLRIKEAVLIGWSMGGMIAMQNCLKRPMSVKALVLIATSGHRIPGLKLRVYFNYLQSLLNLLGDFTQPRKIDRSDQQFPRHIAWLEQHVRKMLSPMASKEVIDWVISDIRENPRESYFTVIKSLWNWEAGIKLSRIKAPTLILAGRNDSLIPLRLSRLLHENISGSNLRVVENASHYLILEQPSLVNAEILKFLERIGY